MAYARTKPPPFPLFCFETCCHSQVIFNLFVPLQQKQRVCNNNEERSKMKVTKLQEAFSFFSRLWAQVRNIFSASQSCLLCTRAPGKHYTIYPSLDLPSIIDSKTFTSRKIHTDKL